jgi:MFS family permease
MIGQLLRMPRGILVLLGAQIASQMGDAGFTVLLLWAVLERTSDARIVGAAAALNYLPILLFGMAGGLAADRLPRRGLMVASDGIRAALCISLPFLAAAGWDSPWIFAAAGFGLFTASAFFGPARDATIPFLAGKADLAAANAVIQVSVPCGWLFGPALCAALLPFASPVTLFAGMGGLFALSVLLLRFLPAEPVQTPSVRGTTPAILEGLVVCFRDARLGWLLVITAADNLFIMGPAIVGTPLFVKEVLGGSGSAYAIMEALLALGVFAGLPLTAWLNRRMGRGKVLILGIFLDGITYLPLLWVESLSVAGLAVGLHGISIPLITVTRTSLVQEVAPPESLGRVFALIQITVLGFTAISSGLTGWAASRVPVPVIFGVIAVAAALCGPAAWLSRKFREA